MRLGAARHCLPVTTHQPGYMDGGLEACLGKVWVTLSPSPSPTSFALSLGRHSWSHSGRPGSSWAASPEQQAYSP